MNITDLIPYTLNLKGPNSSTVELGYNVMNVVITEEYNVMANSEALIGT